MTALVSLVVGALGVMLLTSEDMMLGVVVLLPIVLLDALIGLMLVEHYRSAFWLDGRVLVRRSVLGRQRYDLTAAYVSADSARPVWSSWRGGVLPRLTVQVPGRKPTRLWLRAPARGGALLPGVSDSANAKRAGDSARYGFHTSVWRASCPRGSSSPRSSSCHSSS
ncbi:hypothetical protein, partial [Actinomadura sp.]|uniref:hypothetical protein n=1 Tax=Actinomadura sp. TaxID=1989 RepID=UPI0037C67CEE